ncbi:hypothetical protein [Actinoplanes sp. N902-109]|uniref:hypothetical protein n=1 Tax=Actinoplanes sp. (strain N902-109) TaxID=649831 RepID=UPI001E537023|nr:hypothetical protein [Actinoplanes sp. N902-109]
MSLPADLSPPRRPLFFPVVIATVFLAIIGMSAGLALGTQHDDLLKNAADSGQAPAPVPSDGSATSAAPGRKACPEKMQETSRRLGFSDQLTLVLQVRTEDTGLVVWICQDAGAKLFYQANRGGEQGEWVEGKTALFLENVSQSGDTFVASAKDGATFTVDHSDLRIVKKDGEEEEHPVEVQ